MFDGVDLRDEGHRAAAARAVGAGPIALFPIGITAELRSLAVCVVVRNAGARRIRLFAGLQPCERDAKFGELVHVCIANEVLLLAIPIEPFWRTAKKDWPRKTQKTQTAQRR